MSIPPLYVIGLALSLLILFSLFGKSTRRTIRTIKAFRELRRTIELSVEDGSRLQISLGAGGLLGAESAAAFAGLSLLRQVANIAADSDQPPVATTGDGMLLLLAQDTLRHTYRRLDISDQYHLRRKRPLKPHGRLLLRFGEERYSRRLGKSPWGNRALRLNRERVFLSFVRDELPKSAVICDNRAYATRAPDSTRIRDPIVLSSHES